MPLICKVLQLLRASRKDHIENSEVKDGKGKSNDALTGSTPTTSSKSSARMHMKNVSNEAVGSSGTFKSQSKAAVMYQRKNKSTSFSI